MSTVVSYRIYCDDCTRDTVIKERFLEDESHPWKIHSKRSHSGMCPVCNPCVNENAASFDDSDIRIELESLRGIGSATANRLRERDLITKQDIRSVSISELRNIPGVGKTSIKSLKNAV